ncbi:MAG: PEP-CTERM sorting domain-containing protein [Planctomycetota bacterium]
MRHQLFKAAIAACLIVSPAYAYLGGFEADDGYASFLNDVSKYNAGQYGVNAGGGSFVSITPGTGLWQKLQGPLFPTTGLAGGVAYATGHQNYDRTNPYTSDQALVITTNADGWTAGPQEYSYTLDSFDLGGVSPAATGGTTIDISFWSCSRVFGSGEGGGLGPGTIGNAVSFYDSTGALGFSVGYQQPGVTTDVAATNVGVWNPSTVTINPSIYHRWDVSLDLGTQTVSIDIFESGTLTNLVSSAPLINPMSDFTELRFLGTPGVTNNKIWSLDDFGMTVQRIPEPATALLLLLGSFGLLGQRRR